MSYLPVNVLTNNSYSDSSNGGITARQPERLVVECAEGHLSADDVTERGYTVLELHYIGESFHFKPVGQRSRGMFGGNFVWSSDSRFSKKYGRQPIHVHDRVE